MFPIEVDLKSDAFTYKSQNTFSSDGVEEEIPQAVEAEESLMSSETLSQGLLGLMSVENSGNSNSLLLDSISNRTEGVHEDLLLCELGLEGIELGVSTENERIQSIDDLLK